MAIVGTEDDPNNPNGAAGSGSGAFAGSGGGGASTKVGAPTSSGNYSNLLGYLNANQDASATTAGAVVGNVNSSADASNTANTNLATTGMSTIGGSTQNLSGNGDVFKAPDAGAGPTAQPPDVFKVNGAGVASTNSPMSGGAGGAGKSKTPNVTPTTPASGGGFKAPEPTPVKIGGVQTNVMDSNQYGVDGGVLSSINKGGKAPTVTYGGPTDVSQLGGYQGATDAAGTAGDRAGNAQGGMSGRSALLGNIYTQPGYTSGERGLDSFLTGAGSNGDAITAAGKNAQTSADNYKGVTDALNGQINKNIGDAANTSNVYADAAKNYVKPVAPKPTSGTGAALQAPVSQATSGGGAPINQGGNNPSVLAGYTSGVSNKDAAIAAAGFGDPTLAIAKGLSNAGASVPAINVSPEGHWGGGGFAHGGEVPSYDELLKSLRR